MLGIWPITLLYSVYDSNTCTSTYSLQAKEIEKKKLIKLVSMLSFPLNFTTLPKIEQYFPETCVNWSQFTWMNDGIWSKFRRNLAPSMLNLPIFQFILTTNVTSFCRILLSVDTLPSFLSWELNHWPSKVGVVWAIDQASQQKFNCFHWERFQRHLHTFQINHFIKLLVHEWLTQLIITWCIDSFEWLNIYIWLAGKSHLPLNKVKIGN